jgi:hypothetical protein
MWHVVLVLPIYSFRAGVGVELLAGLLGSKKFRRPIEAAGVSPKNSRQSNNAIGSADGDVVISVVLACTACGAWALTFICTPM